MRHEFESPFSYFGSSFKYFYTVYRFIIDSENMWDSLEEGKTYLFAGFILGQVEHLENKNR